MKTIQPSLEYRLAYQPRFRQHVFQLLNWGYADARLLLQSTDVEEPDISGFIVQAIWNRLRAPNRPPWCKNYTVHDDPPQEKPGAAGRRRPRADVVIEATYGSRPEYIFEAKRLRRDGFGISRYIGKDGLGCFISGTYAAKYDEAGMLVPKHFTSCT